MNKLSADGKTVDAFWVGSHPVPPGGHGSNGVAPDAGKLTLGQYLGCASVAGTGLLAFFTEGMSVTTGTALGLNMMGNYDNINACARAFEGFVNSSPSPDWMAGGTDDMSSMVQGMMQEGPRNLQSLLNFQQSVGPDDSPIDSGNGGANGPDGGTNGGDFMSADGSDQYGYGGTGSLLKANFVQLGGGIHPDHAGAPITFILNSQVFG